MYVLEPKQERDAGDSRQTRTESKGCKPVSKLRAHETV
jgi:hypothetical protein